MESIARWKWREGSEDGVVHVSFEDGTILSLHLGSDSACVQAGRVLGAEVETFAATRGVELRGTIDEARTALGLAFPPRELPAPVIGNDLVYEQEIGSQDKRYYFTGNVIVTYRGSTGQVDCDDASDVPNSPLVQAISAAFPLGATVLPREEVDAVLRHICLPPPVAASQTSLEPERTKPVRGNAPYKDWYSYGAVRLSSRPGGKRQEEVLDEWWNALDRSERNPEREDTHLLVHAPTGLGKTSAALAPALTWQQRAPDSRQVYYLVA